MQKASLAELDAVVAVSRRGNFRAAALELGMSSSALSHAVAGLEARLGVRLYEGAVDVDAVDDAHGLGPFLSEDADVGPSHCVDKQDKSA